MPRPLPAILSEHLSNEHPTSRLLDPSNLDSAAIDIAESSNAHGEFDDVDLGPEPSNANSSKLTGMGRSNETTNMVAEEAAECCSGPGIDILLGGDQKAINTAARSSYSSTNTNPNTNNNTSTSSPLHPFRQSI